MRMSRFGTWIDGFRLVDLVELFIIMIKLRRLVEHELLFLAPLSVGSMEKCRSSRYLIIFGFSSATTSRSSSPSDVTGSKSILFSTRILAISTYPQEVVVCSHYHSS